MDVSAPVEGLKDVLAKRKFMDSFRSLRVIKLGSSTSGDFLRKNEDSKIDQEALDLGFEKRFIVEGTDIKLNGKIGASSYSKVYKAEFREEIIALKIVLATTDPEFLYEEDEFDETKETLIAIKEISYD
jgi:hypothetical protein